MSRQCFFLFFVVTSAMVLSGCRSEKTAFVSPETQIVNAVADSDASKLQSLLSDSPELLETVKDGETTLLHYAARVSTDPAVLQTLLDFGADINTRDGKNRLPIDYAMRSRNKASLRFLLEQAVEDNSYPDMQTLIRRAIKENVDAATLKVLLDKHNDYWLATRLTLDAARYNDDPEVMRLILERGGDANADESQRTPMHYAAAKSSNTKTLQYLMEYHAKIDTRQREDYGNPGTGTPNTPLHYAAKNNPNLEISRWLIKHGGDPFARNSEGETPCDYAVRYNTNPDVVRFYSELLEKNGENRIDKR